MIQTGDIVLFSNKGLISSLIKFVTKSKYSHVGIVMRVFDNQETLIAESLDKGFTVNRYYTPNLLKKCKVGHIFKQMDHPHRIVFRSHITKFLGLKYDWSAIFSILRSILTGRAMEHDTSRQLICSEAVVRIYKSMKLDISEGKPADYVTPGDLARNKKITWRN